MLLSHSDADPSRRSAVGLAVLLGIGLVLAGVLLPLIPAHYRPHNFAVFGAVGLFVGARAGRLAPVWATVVMLLGKLGADLLTYFFVQPGDANYLPTIEVYSGFLFYPLLGWLLLGKSDSFLKMFGTTALAGIPFFLVTNAMAWKIQALPYPQTFDGLMQAYAMGLPFHWATLASDVAFGGLLFATHAELVRLTQPQAIPVKVEVQS